MLCALLLAACPLPQTAAAPPNWRTVVTEADRGRLRDWRRAWLDGLAQGRATGHQSEIAAEGALLDADLPAETPALPPGDYACRTIKLGSQSQSLSYVAYPAFRCRIEARDGVLHFTKLNGSQRPIGLIYPDDDLRMIFLGTMQLGDERRAYRYGIDGERDMVGFVQRIGEARWRLVLPRPRYESLLDVIELTPR